MVCASAPPVRCGVGDYTTTLVRALADDGLPITLFTSRQLSRKENEPALAGLNWTAPIEHWNWGSFGLLRKAVVNATPDLLHLQYPTQFFDSRLIAGLAQWFRHWLGKPVVITLHEHIQPHSLLNLLMAQAADEIVSVRQNFTQGYRRLYSSTVAFKPFHFIPSASSVPIANPTSEEIANVRFRLGVSPSKSMVVYFGLLYPRKGVEQLFRIADPDKDHLFIIGGNLDEAQEYGRHIEVLANSTQWCGRVTLTGFLASNEAAMLMACADAVVLPFTGEGGGLWNTSIHAARSQGTFVLTTSREKGGFDAERNLYWARPGNIDEMRVALRKYIGMRRPSTAEDLPTWSGIACRHRDLYENLVCRRTPERG